MSVVLYEVKDKIAYITLNRPEQMNAVNAEMIDQLVGSLQRFNEEEDAWVGIVSGKGRAFSSGADLKGVGQSRGRPVDVDDFYFAVLTVRKPLIAAVHGYCLAQGDGIALSCDIVIAAEGTKFGWPQAKRGISSVSGPSLGVFRLPRNYAYEYVFTARLFDAQEAYRLNLVNRVVPEDKLMSTAEEMAREILANSPSAVWGMKEAIVKGTDLPLRAKMQIANLISRRVATTEDSREGIQAFIEKRAPQFKGR